MGLPVKRLVIATNQNDSLTRAFATGTYEPRDVIATSSPSMDIQLASNFERLLFELAGRDGARVRARMDELRRDGCFHLEPAELAAMRKLFAAHSISEEDTEMTIRGLYEETGMLIDPHTAVGVAAAREEAGSAADDRAVDGASGEISRTRSSAPRGGSPISPSACASSSARTNASPCWPMITAPSPSSSRRGRGRKGGNAPAGSAARASAARTEVRA